MLYQKVSERIYLVGRGIWGQLKPLTRPEDCNIFLIDGGGELALVDTGIGMNTINYLKLSANISEAGYSIKKIKKIIITHDHLDHTTGIKGIKEHIKVPVIAARGSYNKLRANQYVKDGSIITIGDLKFKVMQVPGHTPDSIALIGKINGQKVIFTGDTAIGDQKAWKGVVGWYDAHWGSDIDLFKKSIKRLSKVNADVMIPSHGMWHTGKKTVAKSLENCLWRLNAFAKIPHLGTMFPVRLTKKEATKYI